MDKGIMARILPEWRQPFTMEGMKTLFSMLFKAVATALGLVLMAGPAGGPADGGDRPGVGPPARPPGARGQSALGTGRRLPRRGPRPAGEVVDIDAREVDVAAPSRGAARPALEEPGAR
jgi:hypothetical protein